MRLLRDVLPKEFFKEHMTPRSRIAILLQHPSPAAKLLDVEVVKEHSRSKVVNDMILHNTEYVEWPGTQQNVHVWWELANGKAVGWNESPHKGWSFPVTGTLNG